MKITYIAHSGFMIELEKSVLLFDYYKGEIPQIKNEKEWYVFASHRHPDHFNPVILQLTEKYANVHFFLSKEIHISEACLKKLNLPKRVLERITYVSRNTVVNYPEDNNAIKIQTLTSTDEGVAFVITCEDKTIYHAGDLNWWHWSLETKAYNRNMEVNYKREIDKLKEMHFNVSFVPLDGRLEEAYGYGMRYFMEQVSSDYIFPMHLWEKYNIIDKYIEENQDITPDNIVRIAGEGMVWNI